VAGGVQSELKEAINSMEAAQKKIAAQDKEGAKTDLEAVKKSLANALQIHETKKNQTTGNLKKLNVLVKAAQDAIADVEARKIAPIIVSPYK
jgi:hypothetical protein